jgi:hypothetical protein
MSIDTRPRVSIAYEGTPGMNGVRRKTFTEAVVEYGEDDTVEFLSRHGRLMLSVSRHDVGRIYDRTLPAPGTEHA